MENIEKRDSPFFYAKIINGNIVTRGQDSCFLGHKLDYKSNGKPDGIFAQWHWDGEKLIVENDRYGFYPVYYYATNDEVCISRSLTTLTQEGAPTEFDYKALAVFLRFGSFISEDTPFKFIKALPPNVAFSWGADHFKINGSYCIQKPTTISLDRAIDEYIVLFRQAIKRRLPPIGTDFVIPLSGGRDSRHILFELISQGYKPKFCITTQKYPPSNGEDIRIAKIITERLKINHTVIPYGKNRLADELKCVTKTNYCADEHASIFNMVNYLKGKYPVIFDGIGGDMLSEESLCDQQLFELYQANNYHRLSTAIFKRWPTPDEKVLRLIINKEGYRKMSLEIAIEHLTNELRRHITASNPMKSFYFWNRTRREISLLPNSILSDVADVYCPYLDHDLYNFLASLPAELPMNNPLHTLTIQRAYPNLADIPFENKNVECPETIQHRKQFLKQVARFSIIKGQIWRSRLLQLKYLIPRMIRASVDGSYCMASWWLSPFAIFYLVELEKLSRRNLNEIK